MRQRLLIFQLIILCVLWVVQVAATYVFMLTDNNFAFSPLHVLGGMWAASFGVWAFGSIGKQLSLSGCIAVALAFGIAWEIFEAVAHLVSPGTIEYVIDTATDLMFDVIGGALAALIIRRI